jgi:hypothetical protein
MVLITRVLAGLTIVSGAAGGAALAQEPAPFDSIQVVLVYHKLTNEPLDLRAWAEASDAVRRASQFDRPDAIKAETARLEGLLAAADGSRQFILQVGDHVSQYDHERGEFSIQLFTPGYYVPVQVLRREYRLVFANAESARSISMPKEQAREFDARLSQKGRRVTNEIRFQVIGKGDPAGAVSGDVIRAELVAVRLLDDAGQVILTPSVASAAAVAAAAPSFDPATADVAGFRLGVAGKDLEATLGRLFGKASRGNPAASAPAGIRATLSVNEMGCMHIMGRRTNPVPGSVCVHAMLDGEDVVRAIRIERVFDWLDGELFRRTMVSKYGPVSAARGGQLAWGPAVDGKFGAFNALTASYATNDDFIGSALNSRPDVRITLLLVDAAWASRQGR